MLTGIGLHPDEIIVDNFAGGGGASLGIELALGRGPDHAINHNAAALAMHAANHPHTIHHNESVWDVKPKSVAKGRPVGLAWFSPDCKHFSKAKGGKPVDKKIRGLAWVACWWAASVKPRIIIVENVEEFAFWGPIGPDGKPCPARKGITFFRWVRRLRELGYKVEWKELRACDYGAPTIRKRLFVVARRDGLPIVWPEPTHGPGRAHPHRTAAECIDFTIPALSIFATKQEAEDWANFHNLPSPNRPLAENTMRRVGIGVWRQVIKSQSPFIVRTSHTGHGDAGKIHSINDPLRAITTKADQSVVTAFLAKHYTGVIGSPIDKAIGTITTVDHHSLVTSQLIHLRGGKNSHESTSADLRKPTRAITANGLHQAEVRAFLVKYYGTDGNPDLSDPLHTVTTKDRFGLVMVKGALYRIVDILMRMLYPRELFRAQGFPDSYQIEIVHNGRVLSKAAQVQMVGNSVSPPVAAALVAANVFATMPLGPALADWEPGLVKPGHQLSLFDTSEFMAVAG